LFADRDALQAALIALDIADVARVSPDLPLRANLSALDNIALIPLYQRHVSAAESGRQARALLDQLGHTDIATLRDPDMSAMLYDVVYPGFIAHLAGRVASTLAWEIYDYNWNQVLYPQGSAFSVSA